MSISDEFPLVEDVQPTDPTGVNAPTRQPNNPETNETSGLQVIWAQLKNFGLAESVLRVATHTIAILLVILVVWGLRSFYLRAQTSTVELPQTAALAAPLKVVDAPVSSSPAQGVNTAIELPAWTQPEVAVFRGIPRYALPFTIVPSRPRVSVIDYLVEAGDTVFGIAEKYGLRPETIFWGNRDVLNDNPHNLRAGQTLNILPTDGTYHQWSTGESFSRVAEFYGVQPNAIVQYPGNTLDEYAFNVNDPQIEAGTWLIVPGGVREFIDWGPPRISRDNPAVATTYGPGHCGSVTDGALGSGSFIWPTTAGYLSGYDYNPAANHPAIDIAGSLGNPIYAVDSGVVVYAGWSNYGYGNLIVIDHGAWQSLYAHLSAISVFCGQSVFQGTSIGSLGSTGNSSGPHLHFELMYGTAKVNPWNYMSP
jgi:murein DD-endopeptidase MepM/ murein hydrolase activator NlpD